MAHRLRIASAGAVWPHPKIRETDPRGDTVRGVSRLQPILTLLIASPECL
jgi:hypothetical protein